MQSSAPPLLQQEALYGSERVYIDRSKPQVLVVFLHLLSNLFTNLKMLLDCNKGSRDNCMRYVNESKVSKLAQKCTSYYSCLALRKIG